MSLTKCGVGSAKHGACSDTSGKPGEPGLGGGPQFGVGRRAFGQIEVELTKLRAGSTKCKDGLTSNGVRSTNVEVSSAKLGVGSATFKVRMTKLTPESAEAGVG